MRVRPLPTRRADGRPRRPPAAPWWHLPFVVLFMAGAGLRVMVWSAYRPALLYVDSYRYLGMVDGDTMEGPDPAGYPIFLKAILAVGDLSWIPAAQHMIGLGLAIAIYALLLRRGVHPGLAALAAAPVLLDAYVLQISQLVMSDLLFITLLFAAAAVLAWRPRPGLGAVAAAGGLLAAAVSVRTVGQPVIIAGLAYVLIVGTGRVTRRGAGTISGSGGGSDDPCLESGRAGRGPAIRDRLLAAGVMAAAFATVLGGYMAWSLHSYGEWGMGTSHTRIMYARAATFVDCRTVELPAYQRPLCPKAPEERRPGVDAYMWSTSSPAYHYRPPAGMSKDAVLADFAWRVFTHQPLGFAREAATDFLRGFVPVKADMPGQVPIKRWQFQTTYPHTDPRDGSPAGAAERFGGGLPQVDTRLATLLRAYQLGPGHVPGIVTGGCLLLGLFAAAGAGRARRSPLRLPTLLFTATGASVLLIAAVFQFSWRYQLPGLVILPIAAALGLTALLHRPSTPTPNEISSPKAPTAATPSSEAARVS